MMERMDHKTGYVSCMRSNRGVSEVDGENSICSDNLTHN